VRDTDGGWKRGDGAHMREERNWGGEGEGGEVKE
jgi:hypothetical protein